MPSNLGRHEIPVIAICYRYEGVCLLDAGFS
jgi:hypothetical protein